MSAEKKVIVITGASSGIGKAIALTLAKKGYRLGLCARGRSALHDTAQECQQLGARVKAFVVDTSSPEQVSTFADLVIATFGRIDIWVNNASIYCVGRLEDIPLDVHQQVMQVNYFGYVYGFHAVLPGMLQQGSGQIINIVSIDGKLPAGYASAYTASKFAVHGLMSAAREELRERNILISNVYPSAIDTPLFSYAPNFFGKKVKPPDPVYDPQQVADTVLQLVDTPRAETVVGGYGWLGSWSYRLFPQLTTRLFARQMKTNSFTAESMDFSTGNAFVSRQRASNIRGGWQ